MKKINIIQFMPYFPPHKGGLETVGEEIGKHWIKKDYGNFINVVFDVGQKEYIKNMHIKTGIYHKQKFIGYRKDGYSVLLIPSFDLINNFPFPKFWSRRFWVILKITSPQHQKQPHPNPLLRGEGERNSIVITHTRFFLSSLVGGIFARRNKLKWVHIEHGSDYVKLGSKLKSKISYIYDKLIGVWIFKKADKVVGISEAVKGFILNEFLNREVEVIYRGLEKFKLDENNFLKEKFKNKKIIGYVGRLYKWKNVESLIKAYYLLNEDIKNNYQLVIIGDGEDLNRLKLKDKNGIVYFTGGKSFKEALELQSQFDIHVHPSSPGGGLATTLLQAMTFGCLIVATPNEGAKEVIQDGINGILLKNDSIKEIKSGIEKAINNFDKKEKFNKINKEIIEDKFSWEKNIKKLYDLIK